MSGEPPKITHSGPDPAPPLGSWQRLYALVLFEMTVTVALLYALARWAE
jgi:hypothetical protein